MIIIKILGILDIFVGLTFWIYGIFDIAAWSGFILLLGLILLIKGVVFILGLAFASIMDIIAGILIIIGSSVELNTIFVVIIAIFILQKGIFSMMG